MSAARWNEITESLRQSIAEGALRPGDRLPSEKVLAAQWGVCRMTAHRALSELERAGLVARKRRVGTVVREQQTEEDASPRHVPVPKGAGTRHVALVFFHTNDFPQVDYAHGFRAGLPGDHHLLFCDTGNDAAVEAEYLKRLTREADAIALYPTCAPENTPLLREMAERVPLICLDRVPEGLDADGFVTDNYGSTLAALRTLTARGHRRVAMLTTDRPGVSSVEERQAAYHDALAEAGVADFESLTARFPRGLGYDFDIFAQSVHSALESKMRSPEPPTALFCLDDFFLAAAVEACDRLKLRIPEEMEILSFSDYPPLATRLARGVHRVVQQSREMGRLAAGRLQERLSGQQRDGGSEVVRLPARMHAAGEHGVPPVDLLR